MRAKLLNNLAWLLGGSLPRNRDDLVFLLGTAHNHSRLLPAGELSMLRNILALPELRVEEIMLPHGKVDWLHADNTLAEVLARANQTEHSRYPVIDNDTEKVTGILHVKRLIGIEAQPGDAILTRKNILQTARVVPESKRLDAMLRDFQYYRIHMMIVADEAGHPIGVVTIEDVLEKIVGAIRDEFDKGEGVTIPIQASSIPNHWQVAGDAPLAKFNQQFHLNLDVERFDTIGGWLANRLGRLPTPNEIVEEGNLRLRATHLNQRRILSLEVELLDNNSRGQDS